MPLFVVDRVLGKGNQVRHAGRRSHALAEALRHLPQSVEIVSHLSQGSSAAKISPAIIPRDGIISTTLFITRTAAKIQSID